MTDNITLIKFIYSQSIHKPVSYTHLDVYKRQSRYWAHTHSHYLLTLHIITLKNSLTVI